LSIIGEKNAAFQERLLRRIKQRAVNQLYVLRSGYKSSWPSMAK